MLLTFRVNLNNLGQANGKNNVFLGGELLNSVGIVCIGVYEKWGNSRTKYPNKGVRGGKKYNHAYFIDENGKFFTKRVTRSEAFKIKLHGIWKKRKFVCEICTSQFYGLIKNKNDVPDCPICNK